MAVELSIESYKNMEVDYTFSEEPACAPFIRRIHLHVTLSQFRKLFALTGSTPLDRVHFGNDFVHIYYDRLKYGITIRDDKSIEPYLESNPVSEEQKQNMLAFLEECFDGNTN